MARATSSVSTTCAAVGSFLLEAGLEEADERLELRDPPAGALDVLDTRVVACALLSATSRTRTIVVWTSPTAK